MPEATPLTVPETGRTVANVLLLLVHIPPAVASVKVEDPPTQALVVPVIPAGTGLTKIDVVV